MLGSAGRDGNVISQRPTGAGSTYVVTDRPAELWQRAQDAGAELVRGLQDEDFGGSAFSVSDSEANIWTFGSYSGEPVPGRLG